MPEQISQLARNVRGLQEQVSKLREASLSESDVSITEVPMDDVSELFVTPPGEEHGAFLDGSHEDAEADVGAGPQGSRLVLQSVERRGLPTPRVEIVVSPFAGSQKVSRSLVDIPSASKLTYQSA